MKNKIINFINGERNTLDKGIVATPENREYLESFAKSNQGSMDILLMQMSINFGYKLAIENLNDIVEDKKVIDSKFTAKDISDAFDICIKQDGTLSAYEGALLMFNTIDILIKGEPQDSQS
tara:strand:+ start:51 stop:413 length:363 start_codon:yes stop_codon:yes gene_type:complete